MSKEKIKIIALSDIHGNLPVIEQECDVVCICGDIVPLNIQKDTYASIAWIASAFNTWCNNLKCKKVFFIAGNHDFVFQDLYEKFMEPYKKYNKDNDLEVKKYITYAFTTYVENTLNLYPKINFLHDTEGEYKDFTFYGTPHIPVLKNWAFYQTSDKLKEKFSKIPARVDVLLTHSPGKFVNDTGVSLQLSNRPEYGCAELTEAVQNKDITLWLCGHVHSGNHKVEDYNGIKVSNVSILDENYKIAYEPLEISIE